MEVHFEGTLQQMKSKGAVSVYLLRLVANSLSVHSTKSKTDLPSGLFLCTHCLQEVLFSLLFVCLSLSSVCVCHKSYLLKLLTDFYAIRHDGVE